MIAHIIMRIAQRAKGCIVNVASSEVVFRY